MFRRRTKKEFPQGTFIPTGPRITAILQLCIIFTILVWNVGYPFMGGLFSIRSQLSLYKEIMGIDNASIPSEHLNKLKRNAARFDSLPIEEKQQIIERFNVLQNKLNVSFFEKMKISLKMLFLEIPPFELTWLFFGLIITLLILKKHEGAFKAIWLLPFIAVIYSGDNYFFALKAQPPADHVLYPSEEMIVKHYLDKPLSQSLSEQKRDLLNGWHQYLIKNWSMEEPSKTPETFTRQVENAEFKFNLARLNLLSTQTNVLYHRIQEPIFLLLLYILWNLFFAYYVTRHKINLPEL